MTWEKTTVLGFLRESNAIEGVYDDASLEKALLAWEYLENKKSIREEDVLKTHEILMEDHLAARYCGNYRDCAVFVGGRPGANHHKVQMLMSNWCFMFGQGALPKSERAAMAAHVAFEKIHPFIDGNGRTGRLLYLWHLKRAKLPVNIIEEKTKFEEYYPLFV